MEDNSLSSSEYFIWFDADAIVLDMDFSVGDVVSKYPNSHFIASADIRQGLINTGVLILKNSDFSRRLFQLWWSSVDRRVVCDQDAFDHILTKVLSEDDRKYIKILPMNSINSRPPAMKYQTPEDPIVHLMGEATELRTQAFKQAYSAVCKYGDQTLPKQLNMTREDLWKLSLSVYSELAEKLQMVSLKYVALNLDIFLYIYLSGYT